MRHPARPCCSETPPQSELAGVAAAAAAAAGGQRSGGSRGSESPGVTSPRPQSHYSAKYPYTSQFSRSRKMFDKGPDLVGAIGSRVDQGAESRECS